MSARIRAMPLVALLLLLGFHSQVWAEVKRIYIAPEDHTDYMWTADEATYKAKA